MAITGLTGVGTVDTDCSRSGHVGACRTVLTAGGQELLGVRVAGGAVLRPAPAGPALGVAGEAGARLPVQAGLAALALRRRAEMRRRVRGGRTQHQEVMERMKVRIDEITKGLRKRKREEWKRRQQI